MRPAKQRKRLASCDQFLSDAGRSHPDAPVITVVIRFHYAWKHIDITEGLITGEIMPHSWFQSLDNSFHNGTFCSIVTDGEIFHMLWFQPRLKYLGLKSKTHRYTPVRICNYHCILLIDSDPWDWFPIIMIHVAIKADKIWIKIPIAISWIISLGCFYHIRIRIYVKSNTMKIAQYMTAYDMYNTRHTHDMPSYMWLSSLKYLVPVTAKSQTPIKRTVGRG